MIFNMGAGGASTANAISYDNTESGLEATNVQGAVDELSDSLGKDETGMTIHEKLDYLMENGTGDTNDIVTTLSTSAWIISNSFTVGKKYLLTVYTTHISSLQITAGANIIKSSTVSYGICALIEATATSITFNGNINNVVAIPLD